MLTLLWGWWALSEQWLVKSNGNLLFHSPQIQGKLQAKHLQGSSQRHMLCPQGIHYLRVKIKHVDNYPRMWDWDLRDTCRYNQCVSSCNSDRDLFHKFLSGDLDLIKNGGNGGFEKLSVRWLGCRYRGCLLSVCVWLTALLLSTLFTAFLLPILVDYTWLPHWICGEHVMGFNQRNMSRCKAGSAFMSCHEKKMLMVATGPWRDVEQMWTWSMAWRQHQPVCHLR